MRSGAQFGMRGRIGSLALTHFSLGGTKRWSCGAKVEKLDEARRRM